VRAPRIQQRMNIAAYSRSTECESPRISNFQLDQALLENIDRAAPSVVGAHRGRLSNLDASRHQTRPVHHAMPEVYWLTFRVHAALRPCLPCWTSALFDQCTCQSHWLVAAAADFLPEVRGPTGRGRVVGSSRDGDHASRPVPPGAVDSAAVQRDTHTCYTLLHVCGLRALFRRGRPVYDQAGCPPNGTHPRPRWRRRELVPAQRLGA